MSTAKASGRTPQVPALEEIDAAIEKAMECDLGTDSPSAWTKHVFESVNKTRPTDQVVTCPPGKGRRGEYLVDLAWSSEESREWLGYRGLLLAMECEWGGDEDALWEDFIKLADVRADRKIFVGAARRKLYEDRERLLKAWASFLSNHRHVPESEEILVALCEKKESEAANHGSWILTGQGEVRQLRPRVGGV